MLPNTRYTRRMKSHLRLAKSGVLLVGMITMFAVAPIGVDAQAAATRSSDEAGATVVFDRVVADQSRLRVFIQAMPKGANLHNHLDGSVYVESYVKMAAEHGFCADFPAAKITPPPCRTPQDELKGMGMREPGRYESFMDLISRRMYRRGIGYNVPGGTTGGGGFPAIYAISVLVPSESMVLARRLAANDNNLYTEFIYQPDILDKTASAVRDTQWDPKDMEGAFQRALPKLKPVVEQAVKDFESYKAQADTVLGCATAHAEPACNVEVRFLSYTRRGDPQDQVFQATMMAFMLADSDPNYVGFNLVGPEDKERALDDYNLNMEMIRFIGSKFPHVHRSLHAGEQTMGKAPPYALVDHVKKAIEVAGAERIGHGTSIPFEVDSVGTLARMARDNVAVEINLTSNDRFGASSSYHPLNLYRAAGVPVTISTDNTGMARVDLSNEYVRAANEHKLSYSDLKYVARTGMQVTFLPGPSLWENLHIGAPVKACRGDKLGSDNPSAACKNFLSTSTKATLQWRYEQQLAKFEHDVKGWRF